MADVSPNGMTSFGQRDPTSGAFMPVTQGMDTGQHVGGLYQGTDLASMYPYGYDPTSIQNRLGKMFPTFNPGFFA